MMDKNTTKKLAKKPAKETPAPAAAESALPALASTPVDLARLGLGQMAYVRQAVVEGTPVWTIHSATGDAIGAAPTLNQAWAAIIQHEMVPVRVH